MKQQFCYKTFYRTLDTVSVMYHHQLPLAVTQNDMHEFTLAKEKIGLEKYLIMLK